MAMDAAHEQTIAHAGSSGRSPVDDRGLNNAAVRVRPDLMAGLGVAARLARLTLQPAAPIGVAKSGRSLRTERLVLRAMVAGDRLEFLRVLRVSRGHLTEFCPLGSADATSDEQVFERQLALSIAAERTGWADGGGGGGWGGRACRLIALDADGRIVGGFNVNDIERGLEHTGELVFWLSADVQRRGYAEEGVRALMELAFADLPLGLGLHRASALIAPGNEPCRRLARKVGLRLGTASAPVELVLGDRRVAHDVYEAFATVGAMEPERAENGHVVEGKPSIGAEVFGRGLLSILRTEGGGRGGVEG